VTNIQYLKKSGWRETAEGWQSPFTKQFYDELGAMSVERLLKGADYVSAKMTVEENNHEEEHQETV